MFKNWFIFKSTSSISCCTLSNLQLFKITNILTKLLSDQNPPRTSIQLSVAEHNSTTDNEASCQFIWKTLSIAEKRADSHAQRGKDAKTKWYKNPHHTQPIPCIPNLITTIENRQKTMIDRIQYHLQHKYKIAFGHQSKDKNNT
jgi:hypothetical protein